VSALLFREEEEEEREEWTCFFTESNPELKSLSIISQNSSNQNLPAF